MVQAKFSTTEYKEESSVVENYGHTISVLMTLGPNTLCDTQIVVAESLGICIL